MLTGHSSHASAYSPLHSSLHICEQERERGKRRPTTQKRPEAARRPFQMPAVETISCNILAMHPAIHIHRPWGTEMLRVEPKPAPLSSSSCFPYLPGHRFRVRQREFHDAVALLVSKAPFVRVSARVGVDAHGVETPASLVGVPGALVVAGRRLPVPCVGVLAAAPALRHTEEHETVYRGRARQVVMFGQGAGSEMFGPGATVRRHGAPSPFVGSGVGSPASSLV